MLRDLRYIEKTYGLPGTFSFADQFLDFEMYFNFVSDAAEGIIIATVVVTVVVFFITSSVAATGLVLASVLLVNFFLVATVFYWDLTFNMISVIQTIIAIGLSVDYSAHIAHTYLVIVPPQNCTSDSEKRLYKAKTAIS